MAPEQCIGAAVEPRTDLYAFGCLMCEALTSELPIVAQSRRELLDLHQRQVPEPMRTRRPDLPIPEAFDEAVMKCLKKRVGDRPRSATELAEMLEAIPRDGLPTSYPPGVGRRPRSLPPPPPRGAAPRRDEPGRPPGDKRPPRANDDQAQIVSAADVEKAKIDKDAHTLALESVRPRHQTGGERAQRLRSSGHARVNSRRNIPSDPTMSWRFIVSSEGALSSSRAKQPDEARDAQARMTSVATSTTTTSVVVIAVRVPAG